MLAGTHITKQGAAPSLTLQKPSGTAQTLSHGVHPNSAAPD